ncbi:hypothetical protein GCM10010368_31930 [Streptomyces roseiscleroticus]|uniref:Uncharacterized protein n=1 Tax=Streptomyces roseiscleroticus TaxID=1972 RepID=A0ABN3EKT0_9ACTN
MRVTARGRRSGWDETHVLPRVTRRAGAGRGPFGDVDLTGDTGGKRYPRPVTSGGTRCAAVGMTDGRGAARRRDGRPGAGSVLRGPTGSPEPWAVVLSGRRRASGAGGSAGRTARRGAPGPP